MAIDFTWIYLLFFLIIPLSRIIPRLIRGRGMKNNISPQTFLEGHFKESSSKTVQEPTRESSKPQTKDMLVLGELNIGTKKFENILKNTGLDNDDLNSILKDLERRELLRVTHKNGFFGPKVELYPTNKGFKEFYSQ